MGAPRLRAATLLAGAASFLAFPLITYLPVIAGDVLKTAPPATACCSPASASARSSARSPRRAAATLPGAPR
jgi:hypothetical protein